VGRSLGVLACVSFAIVACVGKGASSSTSDATTNASATNAGIDALNARLVDAYKQRDPQAYAALYTDSAVFEWPAIDNVRGPSALGAMARDIWAAERDVELRLKISTRRVAADHATEFGAFEQTWTDSAGVRRTEFGRYVSFVVKQRDGSWRLDRFFGFEDSTRLAKSRH
jgi:uncharacterized protein (TIGR02246 family)